METPVRLWSQHIANLARAAFWLLLTVILLLQLTGSGGDSRRAATLSPGSGPEGKGDSAAR